MEVHGGVPAAAAIPPASPFEPRVPFLRTTDMRPGSSDDHLRPAAPAPAAAARFYIGEPIVVDPEPGPGPGAGAASTAIATLGHGAQQFMQRAQNFAHHFLPLMRRAAASGLEVIPIQVGGINLGDIPVQVLQHFVHHPQELVGGLAAMWVFAQAPAFQLLNPGDTLFQELGAMMEQNPDLAWDHRFWYDYNRALEDYQRLNEGAVPPALIHAINILSTFVLRFISGGTFARYFPTIIRMMRGMFDFC